MILLVCDHKKRELEGLSLLKNKLNGLNIKTKIINKHSVIRAYNYYKPKIIIFPSTVRVMGKNIDTLYKKVKLILIPSEHCALRVDFIKLHYCGYLKNHNFKSAHKKLDYVFVQGPFIKKHLVQNNYFKKEKIIVTGHLQYDFWSKVIKKKNNKIENIGIALTNVLITRRQKNKNFLKSLFLINNEFFFVENYWRLLQLNYDFYYLCLVFDIIKDNIKKFKISLRSHVVDVESKFNFIKSNNFTQSNAMNAYDWIKKQDIIISSVSFMNIDAYVFKKPHISLVNLIPKEFMFKSYNSYTYKLFDEPNSFKPKSIKEFNSLITNIKFKKNKLLDQKLKSYYNYPYKQKPSDIMADKLNDIYLISENNFKHIELKKDKFFYKIFGGHCGSFLVYQLAQLIGLLQNYKKSKNWYFDFFYKK